MAARKPCSDTPGRSAGRRSWTSSSPNPQRRISLPASSIVSWCATTFRRSFRIGSATCMRSNNYEIAPFLRTVFLSRDFYSPASVGTHIKGPVELIVSTYRRLGLKATPGMPDFNSASTDLGQTLLNPPTVAGWSQGRAWITPGSLLARGNFARAVLLPDVIAFTDPNLDPYPPQLASLQRPHQGGRGHHRRLKKRGRGRRQGSATVRHGDREPARASMRSSTRTMPA